MKVQEGRQRQELGFKALNDRSRGTQVVHRSLDHGHFFVERKLSLYLIMTIVRHWQMTLLLLLSNAYIPKGVRIFLSEFRYVNLLFPFAKLDVFGTLSKQNLTLQII